MPHTRERRPNVFRVFAGVVIIGVGLFTLAERLEWLEPGYSGDGWPFIVLAVGVVKLLAPPVDRQGRTRSRRTAGWLLAVGVWGLLNEYRLMGLEYATSWPLLIVYAGIDMVWKSVKEPHSTLPGRTR